MLTDVSDRAGPPWQILRVARGLATGDLDNDGRMDLLVLSQDTPLAYFHNRSAAGHFLTLRLEGTKSNREAVGARVTMVTRSGRQVAFRFGGGSYQSTCDRRIHFGLGKDEKVQSIEVLWPSGQIDRFGPLAGDTGYLLREGQPVPTPLSGFTGSPGQPQQTKLHRDPRDG
jgi:hypothetical protein